MEPGARIIKGSFIVLINNVIVVISAFVYTIALTRLLGKSGYGVVSTGLAWLNVLGGIAAFGIPYAVVKLVSKYIALKKSEEVKSVLRISLRYLLTSALIFSATLALLARLVAADIYHDSNLTNVFRVVALMIPPSMLMFALLNIFQGFQKFRYSLLTESLSSVLRVPIAIAMVIAGYFATGALLGTAAGLILGCILGFFLLSKIKLKASKGGGDKLSQEIKAFALPAWLGGIAWTFLLWYGTLLLGHLVNMQEVGLYSSAFAISSFLLYVPGIIGAPLFPLVSELWTLKDRKRLASTVKISIKLIFTILMPLIAAAVVFPEFILLLICGKEFVAGANVLRIFSLALFFLSIKGINDTILSGIGRPDASAKINASAMALAIITITPLAWLYGIHGTAAGFLGVQIFASCLGALYVTKLTGLTYPLVMLNKQGLAVGVMLTLIVPLRLIALNVAQAVLMGIMGLLVYALVCLKVGVIERDDVSLLRQISSDMGEPMIIVKAIKFLERYAK
jgi:stage V sporulation protein B